MKYITLPGNKPRRLSFYLAMEEYAARHIEVADDLFFMWRVRPSVIFGRNQVIETEVNTAYCRAHGIEMYRRKSGGGCVYADMGNVMLSYITRDENVNLTFNRYINLLVLVLYKLGVEAQATGRNDVLIDGRKVSGNAFYHIPGRSIVHGTMLFDTDMAHITAAITPPDMKLESKGVKSVRQHIALLKDHLDISIDDFQAFVRQQLCDGEIVLDEQAVSEIAAIEQEYLSDEFIYGHNPRYGVRRTGRIEGVGQFDVRAEVRGGRIAAINLLGDYFQTGDIDAGIIGRLKGAPFTPDGVRGVLPEDLSDYILHLRREPLIRLIFDTPTTDIVTTT